jgi:hypothetical protein
MDENDFVEHDFRHCELSAIAASHDAHRPVGKSGERSCNGGKGDVEVTDFKHS